MLKYKRKVVRCRFMNPLSINLPFSPGDAIYHVFIDETNHPNYMRLIISQIQIIRNEMKNSEIQIIRNGMKNGEIQIAVCFVNYPFINYTKEMKEYFVATAEEAEKRCAEIEELL